MLEKESGALQDESTEASGDWRGKKLSQLLTLIKQADPAVVEEEKWKKASRPEDVPVWSELRARRGPAKLCRARSLLKLASHSVIRRIALGDDFPGTNQAAFHFSIVHLVPEFGFMGWCFARRMICACGSHKLTTFSVAGTASPCSTRRTVCAMAWSTNGQGYAVASRAAGRQRSTG